MMGIRAPKFLSAPLIHIYMLKLIFISGNFRFLLFLGMLMHANEVETKGKIKIT